MSYNIKYKLKVLLKKYKDCESEGFKTELHELISTRCGWNRPQLLYYVSPLRQLLKWRTF